MHFFSMKNKMIIDITSGEKVGILQNCDLEVDEKTGRIIAVLLPKNKFVSLFSSELDYTRIPWEKIRKIGKDTIIVEL